MIDRLQIISDKTSPQLHLIGHLDLNNAQAMRASLQKYNVKNIDVSGLTKLDTIGALFLRQITENKRTTLTGLKPEHKAIYEMVAQIDTSVPPAPKKLNLFLLMLIGLGRQTAASGKAVKEFIAFLGQVCVTLRRCVCSIRHLRIADIMHHIEQTGINAIPIISVMAFMIAIVLAYQGVAQLRPLGAESLTVNLVSISVLREMGVLLTAIMVAGRSGSAFTAEIGVMKVREEVDALRTIGIDPFEVLIMPRLIALIITLPLLTFIADCMGILGGGIMSKALINIPLDVYFERVRAVVPQRDLWAGMIKAPVFAFLIAMVGCMHGMKVSGSAGSVGRETTNSVVKAIFLVLIADAAFSIIFEKVGI